MNVLTSKATSWDVGLLTLLAASALLTLSGCDLTPQTYSTITPDEFYQTKEEFRAAIVPVYAPLEALVDGWWYWDSQVSTDESIVPTRGQDWGAGGIWRRLHTHSWTPTDPASAAVWRDSYRGIARANTVLDNLEDPKTMLSEATIAGFRAELRTLRAFYYYTLMDLFGGVPLVTEPAIERDKLPSDAARRAVFAFVEKELRESIPDLPLERTGGDTGRMTKGAARAILANMYLNAEVFTAKLTANGLQGGTPMYQEAIEVSNVLLNSGVYRLADGFFANFTPDNYKSPEIIFAVQFVEDGSPAFNYHYKVLHYDQWPQGCCNGLATQGSSYDTFDSADVRREMFLTGRAYNLYTGEPAFTRGGEPLIFTKEVPLIGASEGAGYRPLKWPVAQNNLTGGSPNDFAFFRLAEIYFIKAEALWRLNGPNQQSLDLINRVRERAFEPDQPIAVTEVTEIGWEQFFLDARTREFHSEAKRRQDLIRFGRFNSGIWEHKKPSEPWRVVFPIPQSQLDANPNLTQNPGY